MEQRPSWEANRLAASQESPRILWNPKVHYRIHKCPPPVPVLTQLDSVHTPTFHFLKIHLNITLPSKPGSPKWSVTLRFPQQNPLYASILPHSLYMPRPSHSSWFYHPKNIGWGVGIIMQFSLLPCSPVPLSPKYSPQHPILKHPQPTFSGFYTLRQSCKNEKFIIKPQNQIYCKYVGSSEVTFANIHVLQHQNTVDELSLWGMRLLTWKRGSYNMKTSRVTSGLIAVSSLVVMVINLQNVLENGMSRPVP